MKQKLWLAVIGAVGVAAFGTACGKQPTGNYADKKVEAYLGAGGPMETWGKKIEDAICQLEKVNTGLDNTKRICPEPPGDKVVVPTYPPP
jgi:hypothetical protein